MTKKEKFEQAIKDFGIESTMEYFSVKDADKQYFRNECNKSASPVPIRGDDTGKERELKLMSNIDAYKMGHEEGFKLGKEPASPSTPIRSEGVKSAKQILQDKIGKDVVFSLSGDMTICNKLNANTLVAAMEEYAQQSAFSREDMEGDSVEDYKMQQLEKVAFDAKLKEVWDAAREGTHNDGTMLPFGQGYKYPTLTEFINTLNK